MLDRIRQEDTIALSALREPTLQEIHDSLDIPGHRVELIGGRIIVSPSPVIRHREIVFWLAVTLADICAARGWSMLPQTTFDLLATEERIVPDVLVYLHNGAMAGERLVPTMRALLVVEVVSFPSKLDDSNDKCESCARNGIPMYLFVDPFDATLTLCTEPSDQGYRMIHTVDVGGKLDLPEPFGTMLDTTTIPIKPRARQPSSTTPSTSASCFAFR